MKKPLLLFEGTSFVHYLVYFSTKIFGQTDLALRLPFIVLHVASLILLYKIGKLFLKRKIDRVVSVALYAMLPGVNSVAILVNGSYVAIFLTLLFVIYFTCTDIKRYHFLFLIVAAFLQITLLQFCIYHCFFTVYLIKKNNFLVSLWYCLDYQCTCMDLTLVENQKGIF